MYVCMYVCMYVLHVCVCVCVCEFSVIHGQLYHCLEQAMIVNNMYSNESRSQLSGTNSIYMSLQYHCCLRLIIILVRCTNVTLTSGFYLEVGISLIVFFLPHWSLLVVSGKESGVPGKKRRSIHVTGNFSTCHSRVLNQSVVSNSKQSHSHIQTLDADLFTTWVRNGPEKDISYRSVP